MAECQKCARECCDSAEPAASSSAGTGNGDQSAPIVLAGAAAAGLIAGLAAAACVCVRRRRLQQIRLGLPTQLASGTKADSAVAVAEAEEGSVSCLPSMSRLEALREEVTVQMILDARLRKRRLKMVTDMSGVEGPQRDSAAMGGWDEAAEAAASTACGSCLRSGVHL